MAETITITPRWAGPADAGATSTYKIEYTWNGGEWTELASEQAATSPYVSPSSTLASNATRGDTTIALSSATGFSSAGYGYVDDALIEWKDKTGDNLTNVIWHSGYGIYASGSPVYEAHEEIVAENLDYDGTVPMAVVFRITHTNPDGKVSPPAYLWHFVPLSVPANCCAVITVINTDLGFEPRANVFVDASLQYDKSFALISGAHLDKGQSAAKSQETTSIGITQHACWRSSAREAVGLADTPYTFILDSFGLEPLTVTVNTIPDLPWVLLSQIATGAS